METKKPWQSKTLVVNAVLGVIAFIALFFPGAEAAHTFINAHGSEIGMLWALLNIVLRAITKDKIGLVD